MSVEQASINDDRPQPPAQSLIADSDPNEAIDKAVWSSLEEVQEEGEPDLIVELIDLYLDDAPARCEAIRTAAAQLDGMLLKRAAHALKGSSGSLGVCRVAEICNVFEQSDCTASPAAIAPLLELFEREFARARAALLAERERRLS